MRPTHSFDLTGELALITGGGTGIGLGIARALVAQGARVVLTGRREEPLQAAVEELGAQATYRIADITAFASAEALVAEIEASVGPISILVNNAGKHLKKASADVTEAEFLDVLNVHVLGAHAVSRAVAAGMLKRGKGSIVFIASMTSLMGLPLVVAYSAAKSAYLGMVRSLAAEWSPSGVRVNAVAPGWIETEMMQKAVANDPERKAKILGRTPMQQFGQTEDVGWAVAYLCSPAARFVTGVCLPVDGGASIGF